jgi:hypothetical protein
MMRPRIWAIVILTLMVASAAWAALGDANQPMNVTVVSGGAGSPDTELPTAAALADNVANPTTPMVGAAAMGWDGAVWQRPILHDGSSDTKSTALTGLISNSRNAQFNGTTWERERGTTEATLLTSAARTSAPTTASITTYDAQGITVVMDVTAVAATPDLTVTIEGVDAASTKQYAILTGASVSTVTTNVYKVYPGVTVAANAAASQPLPRTIDINIAHGDADSATYTLGYVLHN